MNTEPLDIRECGNSESGGSCDCIDDDDDDDSTVSACSVYGKGTMTFGDNKSNDGTYDWCPAENCEIK